MGAYKRKLSKTTEPKGSDDLQGARSIFVVQRHDARTLHYDFRIQLDGVLKSWAIPKGPVNEPGVKRLAVQTEDHPMEYADFEGHIPEGEYGAGQVTLWDRGDFIPLEVNDKTIIMELKGKKLKGTFCLIHFARGGEKNWLFFKKEGTHPKK